MKQKVIFLIASIAMMVSVASCRNEYEEAYVPEQVQGETTEMDEIISRANHFYSLLPGKTRADNPKVSGIELIDKTRTRANSEDSVQSPKYYIVNYEDNAGFVMVGGNENSDPLVALSDEGNLHLTDTMNNAALAAFVNELNDPSRVILPRDSDILIMPVQRVSVAPKLSSKVRKWGTGSPFNKYTPLIEGQHAKVSCAAISCAMLMSCYQWPNVKVFSSIDWNAIINNNCDDQLCQILRTMGNPLLLDTSYGLNRSYSSEENIANVFQFYYYSYESYGLNLSNFDVSTEYKVSGQLPLLMWGDFVDDDGITYTKTWIIDGLLHVLPSDGQYMGITKSEYFMHCVWGDYGIGNGYFKLDRLGSLGGHRFTIDNNDGTFDGYSNSPDVPTYTNTSYMYRIYKQNPIAD